MPSNVTTRRSGKAKGMLLRLGSLESAAGVRLPRFHARYPDIAIQMTTDTTGALLRQLERFEIDVAFVLEPFEPGRFTSVAVFDEELVLITAKGDRPLRRAADLGGKTVVAFPHGCGQNCPAPCFCP